MPTWVAPALVAAAYLLGSVSFAILVARQKGVDVRAVGSGNPGATNVGRAVGKGLGRLVLVLDLLKGLVPVVLARALALDPAWVAGVGVAAVVGHCFPIWHGLRGGKGAATGLGVLLGTVPWAGAATALAYVALKKASRRTSVGSLGGAAVGAAVTAALHNATPPTWMSLAILALVVVRHHDNLARLARNQEPPS